MKRQVDWLVNSSLTGPIFSRALNLLTQLEIFLARDKDWPVNESNRDITSTIPIQREFVQCCRPLMKIVYRISEQDFMEARDLFIANEKPWYRKLSRRLMPWIGGFVLLMQVFYLAVVPHRDIGFTVISLLVGFYLLYCGFALRRYFRQLYQRDHRFMHDFTAEISDQGIRVSTPFSDGLLKWNGFIRFLESKDIFMVFVAQWNFIIFPKRAFTASVADEFRAALQRNIAPAT